MAEDAASDDSLEERLARADRAIRRAQLEQKIRELGGLIPESNPDADVSDIELEFLNHVIAWETGPFSTHCEWLARHGLIFATPEELRGRALKKELWRLIEALAVVARVFLYHTNHLSDAELYARLFHEVLDGDGPDFARTPDDACHWDFADAGSGEETLWLTFYADDQERKEWVQHFPDVVLPPKRRPPYRRDHRLPVRD